MISVCIATHNGGKYIKQQLESILCQLGEEDEIVISDDGSTDETLSVIEGLKDKKIKIYQFKQPSISKHPHEYVCHNFENALKHAQGDYIFLSDQDDVWMPNKVEVCLKDLQEHDLVLHDFSHMDGDGHIIKDLHYNGTFYPRNFMLAHKGKHYGCAMAFRKQVLDYALPFPKHLLLHDCWIGLLTEALGSFCLEQQSLLKYRIHHQNTSVTHNALWFKVLYRLQSFFLIAKRIIWYKFTHRNIKDQGGVIRE